MTFGLTSSDYQILQTLLLEPLKKHHALVWVFGSRARGDHKEFSDIDILFDDSRNPISPSLLFKIKDSLEESNITIKVDLVNLKDLAKSYKDSVFRDRKKIELS